MTSGGEASTLELVFLFDVPILAVASLRRDLARGFKGVQPLEAALRSPPLGLRPLLLASPQLLHLSEADIEDKEGAKSYGKQRRGCHFSSFLVLVVMMKKGEGGFFYRGKVGESLRRG